MAMSHYFVHTQNNSECIEWNLNAAYAAPQHECNRTPFMNRDNIASRDITSILEVESRDAILAYLPTVSLGDSNSPAFYTLCPSNKIHKAGKSFIWDR